MLRDHLPPFVAENYYCGEWNHASAIMTTDFPNEWKDLMDVLSAYRLKKSYITKPGGNKSQTAKFIDEFLGARGWRETRFDTKIVVDEIESETPTHKIDMFKNGVAIEVEWNNKDPFFDRDLNNFRLLYMLRTVSVGVIITRSDELQEIFNRLDRGSSYGNNTTHLSQLIPRIEGGGAGGCPVLTFGIKASLYREDE
ncbi:restriction endonuclease [Rhodosalinus halophilus]|uniref:Restriction endonuclease n=1 Tax=Rhodosalinus halophilus TaxID=2259333 RepID=A0A365UDB9_9RHOB|nr:BglII/BstYI family type II restriction endonuclease [Rhodosalinus halophilus]RBI86695.1 restriction endonuclease [Rhodosalinus halophilus]